MDKKTASWVSYLTFIGGIIVLSSVKDDKEVRTHAWQSIFLSCAYAAVAIVIAIINGIIIAASPLTVFYGGFWLMTLIGWLAWVAYLVLSIVCIVKATQGGMFKLPLIYTWAEKMK
jgi:uncharacterized membrane protein